VLGTQVVLRAAGMELGIGIDNSKSTPYGHNACKISM